MSKPQMIFRELDVCEKCKRVDSFRKYKQRGNRTYLKCECGHNAVRRDIVKLRSIKAV